MVIGVNINGVLRDFFGKIEDVHRKYFPEHEEITIKDYNLDEWITFPIEEVQQNELQFDPNYTNLEMVYDEPQDIKLETKTEQVTLEEFLYEKCTLEIFGSANEIGNNYMLHLTNLILNHPQHEFVIISNETGLSIPATLFFLSKTKFQGNNIKFVTNNKDCWEHVNVMITDNPDVINTKPENGIVIKIKKDFNNNLHSDIIVDNLKEVDETILSECYNKLNK